MFEDFEDKVLTVIPPPGGDKFLDMLAKPISLQVSPEVFIADSKLGLEALNWVSWCICWHWLYKKSFNPKVNLKTAPFIKKLKLHYDNNVKPLEPMGKVFSATLRLVEYVYLYGEKTLYATHWEWFEVVAKELFNFCLVREDLPTNGGHIACLRALTAHLNYMDPNQVELPNLQDLIRRTVSLPPHHVYRIKALMNGRKPNLGLIHALEGWTTALLRDKRIFSFSLTSKGLKVSSRRGCIGSSGRGTNYVVITPASMAAELDKIIRRAETK
jgi:hypothetical protein